MEKTNVYVLFPIMLSVLLIIFLVSPWSATGQQDFHKNDNTKDNTPIIRISHTDRAVEGQLVTLDASKSFDPDGEPIKFSWKKVSPNDLDVHISNGNSPIASFIAPPVKIDVPVSIELLTIDENGNKDTALIHITISKKQIEGKKDQIDKPKTKSQDLTSIKPNPQARSEPEQPQLSNQLSKSPHIVDKKIKVNAGKDIEVANGTLVKLHGSISSNSDSKQIKLSWTQKKGPHVDLSSNVVLNPAFMPPDVQQDERIQFEFKASDQNGHTVSDSIDVFVLPDLSKGQNNGQNRSPSTTNRLGASASSSNSGIIASSADTSRPTVTSTTPTSGATGVLVTSSITATFSEAIKSSTITTSSFILKTSTGTGIPGTISYISTDGKTATFKPSSSLSPSTSYRITLSPSTARMQDLAGNTMATKRWSFTTTADTSRPTVTSTTPTSGATGVLVTSITATFSEPVRSSTVSTTTFTLKAGTASIPGSVTLTNGNLATFDPSSSLADSTSYTATITTAVKDLAGNAMTADKIWSFTTAAATDTTPPTVVSTTPTSGATGVAVTTSITATFSEAIKSSTITTSSFILKTSTGTGIPGTISYISTDGKTATFKPSSSLSPSTSYTITLSPSTARIQDLAGNTLATITKSFSTTAQSGTANKAGLYVPLFTYPTSSMWNTLISAKNNHPNLPMLVTINPSSGVGSSKDSNFVNGINQLKSAGITVIGYVYTDYGQRSTTVIQDEIDKYKSWYGVNGIFFDEMSTASGKESYYSSLNSYVKSSGMTFTMGNPGTDTRSSYIGTVDNMIIYENQGLPSIDSLKGWHLNYDKKNFSIIPYGVATLNTQFINDAKNYVGYIYVTDDILPNPWNSLPSYFDSLASVLDQ